MVSAISTGVIESQAAQLGDAPEPGPLDFYINGSGLTEFEVPFGVAKPNVVVGMTFSTDGGIPTIVVSHEGEPFDTVIVNHNVTDGICAVIAIGSDLTVETGVLKVEVSGCTIGGILGRVNELPDDVTTEIVEQSLGSGTATRSEYIFAEPHAMFSAVAILGWAFIIPSQQSQNIRYFGAAVMGTPMTLTQPNPLNAGWQYDAGEGWYSRVSGNQMTPGMFGFAAPFTGPIVGFAYLEKMPDTVLNYGSVWTSATQVQTGSYTPFNGPRVAISNATQLPYIGGSVRLDVGSRFRDPQWYNAGQICSGIFQSTEIVRIISTWQQRAPFVDVRVQLRKII